MKVEGKVKVIVVVKVSMEMGAHSGRQGSTFWKHVLGGEFEGELVHE